MVKCLPEFEYFYYILKNRKFISKIRRSKVTDYAALRSKFHSSCLCRSQAWIMAGLSKNTMFKAIVVASLGTVRALTKSDALYVLLSNTE